MRDGGGYRLKGTKGDAVANSTTPLAHLVVCALFCCGWHGVLSCEMYETCDAETRNKHGPEQHVTSVACTQCSTQRIDEQGGSVCKRTAVLLWWVYGEGQVTDSGGFWCGSSYCDTAVSLGHCVSPSSRSTSTFYARKGCL